MYCPQCSQQVSDELQFCPKCGREVDGVGRLPAGGAVPEACAAPGGELSPRGKGLRQGFKLILLCLVLLPLHFVVEGLLPSVEAALVSAVGLALLISGTALRWAAIFTLKKYFTVNVTIFEDHRLVRDGLYGRLRHPSYAGLLLRYLGLGLAYANWLSLALVFLPLLGAVLYRIRVEEAALAERFGASYAEYARSTRRLIPKIY